MLGMVDQALEWAAIQLHRYHVHKQFRLHLGKDGDFENPRTHQEKVQFRKIYGNHAFYAQVTDKYRVREYVEQRIGARYLIPLLAAHDRLKARHFDSLPERFIIKANHGCKWHQVVRDKSALDIPATVKRFNKYMRARYGRDSGERHYRFIKPKIVIEELLESHTGGCPWDYSFFAYNSAQGFDYNYAIVSPDGRGACYTKDGELLVSKVPQAELAPHLNPPNFGVMVDVARALSADFDFVRVDLYNVGGRVYFGELTCTPHQGYGAIAEPRRQQLRDEMWHLDALNPLLYRAPRAHAPRLQAREPALVAGAATET